MNTNVHGQTYQHKQKKQPNSKFVHNEHNQKKRKLVHLGSSINSLGFEPVGQPYFCPQCRKENVVLDELFSEEMIGFINDIYEFETMTDDALLNMWADKEIIIKMEVEQRKHKKRLKPKRYRKPRRFIGVW